MEIKLFEKANGIDVFDKLEQQDSHPATATADAEPDTSEPDPSVPTDLDPDNDNDNDNDNDDIDDDDADKVSAPTPRRRLLRRVIIVVAGVTFVAALGFSGFVGWQLKQQDDTAAAGRAALAVAQTYAVALTSVDNRNIDQNFAQVLNGATGEFKDMYSQSASQLRQVLIDNKAVSKGTVVDASIKSASKTEVVVLLFIDQSISNIVNPQPRIDRSRVRMTMKLVDNHWLASKIDII
ncbi:membrane protein [Mycobacteroides abscessus]|uniref:hypothetical protein n=1 Tax=Mycobacteroides abscessus TaxID=36809 RepID=UPI0005DEEEE4|nr:hypothetical protein [Mycobacteroides abscessus]CPU62971.1 membrane protein [Mycobacteroides abscessus]